MQLLKFAALSLFCLVLVTPSRADAQNNQANDQYIEFEDADPLSAEAARFLGDTIMERVRPPRATLIRPRTSFVDALYKSIEQI